MPDDIKARSLLLVRRTHDLAAPREEAKRAYQTVVDDFGKQRAVVDEARLPWAIIDRTAVCLLR